MGLRETAPSGCGARAGAVAGLQSLPGPVSCSARRLPTPSRLLGEKCGLAARGRSPDSRENADFTHFAAESVLKTKGF